MYKGNKKGFKIVHRNVDRKMLNYIKYYGLTAFFIIILYGKVLRSYFQIPGDVLTVIGVLLIGFLVLFLVQRNRVKNTQSGDLLLFEGSNTSIIGLEIISELFRKGVLDLTHIGEIEKEIHAISSKADADYFRKNFNKGQVAYTVIDELFLDEVIGIVVLLEYLINVKLAIRTDVLRPYLYQKLKVQQNIQNSLNVYLSNPNTTYKNHQHVYDLLEVVDLKGENNDKYLYNKETFKQMKSRPYEFSKGDQKVVRHFYQDYYHQVWRIFKQWKKMK